MATQILNYEEIDRPYDNFLQRTPFSDENGNVEKQPVKSDGAMSDVWIKNFIRSENWQPKTSGFYIDGQSGYAEFSSVFVSGTIEALSGKIGSKKNYWSIGANGITATADTGNVFINYGKTSFTDYSTNGFILGFSGTEQLSKFLIGSATEYIEWDGNNLNIVGSIDVSTKLDKVGGAYNSSFNTSRVRIFPNSSVGIQITDVNGSDAFVVYVGNYGDFDAGDVAIGNVSGQQGILYDQSLNTTTFYGYIKQSEILGGVIETSKIGERIKISVRPFPGFVQPQSAIDFLGDDTVYGYIKAFNGNPVKDPNPDGTPAPTGGGSIQMFAQTVDTPDVAGIYCYATPSGPSGRVYGSVMAVSPGGVGLIVEGNGLENAVTIFGQDRSGIPGETIFNSVWLESKALPDYDVYYQDKIFIGSMGSIVSATNLIGFGSDLIPEINRPLYMHDLGAPAGSVPARHWDNLYVNVVYTDIITSHNPLAVFFNTPITLQQAESDPPGEKDGTLYHNILTGYVRVKQNGTWANLGSGGGGGANTELSNLGTTTINASLIPDTTNSYDLGSVSVAWRNVFVSGVFETNSIVSYPAGGEVFLLSPIALYGTTSDPASIDGGLYYNSSTKKFRGKANGAWADLGSGGTSTLSGLSIDTTKDWGSHGIIFTSGTVTMNGRMKIPVGTNLY